MKEYLREIYREYVTTVSGPGRAIGWPALSFIWDTLPAGDIPIKILDLGCGISTACFMLYKKAENRSASITTVDTSEKWLTATAAFLFRHSLIDDVAPVYTWDIFTKLPNETFDYVLVDIASTTHRRKAYVIPIFERYCGDRTVVWFDDMNKDHLRKYVINTIKERFLNYSFEHLIKETRDEYKRYLTEVKVRGGKDGPGRSIATAQCEL